MATPNPSSSSAEQPALADSNAAFRKFDDYPWVRDRQFLQGLVAMLGPLSNSFEQQKALGVTLQARIWWYKSRLNISVERSAYETYTSLHPSSTDPSLLDKVEDIQRRMGLMPSADPFSSAASSSSPGSNSNLPEWMVSAPQKVDLNRKADDGAARDGAAPGGGSAPYPAHFQAIIEAVTTGKPVAGVKDIPNTVVRQAGILPVGKMQAPRKPWERQQQSDEASLAGPGRLLDEEFPPVSDETEPSRT